MADCKTESSYSPGCIIDRNVILNANCKFSRTLDSSKACSVLAMWAGKQCNIATSKTKNNYSSICIIDSAICYFEVKHERESISFSQACHAYEMEEFEGSEAQ
jgi:hypothetical protein